MVLFKPLVEKQGMVWVAPSPRSREGPSRLQHQQETKVQPRRTLLAQQSETESLVPGGTRSGASEQPQPGASVVVCKPSSSLLQTRLLAPLLARSAGAEHQDGATTGMSLLVTSSSSSWGCWWASSHACP